MIKTTPRFTKDFMVRYRNEVSVKKVFKEICEINQFVPYESKRIFEYYFSLNNIIKLTLLPANYLKWYVKELEINLPIIIQRYNPTILLTDFDISKLSMLPESTRNKADKLKVIDCLQLVIAELNRIKCVKNEIIVDELISYINNSTLPGDIRKSLEKVKGFLNGKPGVLNEIYPTKFPIWVNMLEKAFDYEHVSKKFGHEINGFYNIGYCPYCNDEPIHSIQSTRKTFRPPLDHFLPKALYPFLAVSIYNLIPSGTRCNNSFKLMRDTRTASNPNLITDQIPHQAVFLINYIPDVKISTNNISIDILNVSEKFKVNTEIFGLYDVYNKPDTKQEVAWIMERIEFLRDSGTLNETLNDFNRFYLHLKIQLGEKANNFRWKKLLLDTVNQMTNSSFNACI
ncbi:hypothetical protein CXM81_22765 [Citrobacter freundii]|uniref:hypothetical protein n=1 Tax=Citrobacter sp. MGH105 TaxID=1686380 RepID=UPI000651E0EE|nr:hypothetical protein [Citrobacter sp. MGH105]QNM18193.1 hypothetical protein CXM87_22770 [Citrobacter freundii]QNM23656.1 hypothetical protein CXM82_24030 [Citrobacter freundii]QNM28346.1 hypothetical protein CXM80_22750 [Citrobacter freundii]QNM33579.1 hypothetical protein CXM81_22765 [Citrobacter freundii]